MFILLKGPPASGKSTTIKYLQDAGYLAIDLEKTGSSKEERTEEAMKVYERYKRINEKVFIGMADVSIEVFPENALSVLVLPNQGVYEARLEERDRLHPHKRFQNGKEKYKRMERSKEKYDYILENNTTVEESVNQLTQLKK